MVEQDLDHFIDPPMVESELFQIDASQYYDLYDIPKLIIDTICEYFNSGRWRNENLIINSFPGSGKTYIISKFLASIRFPERNPFLYMTINHQISTEFYNRFVEFDGKECYYIQGKATTDLAGNPVECTDPKGFDIVKKYGINTWYCKKGKCPLYGTCHHQLNIHAALTQTHAPSLCGHYLLYNTLFSEIVMKKFPLSDYIIVMDEDMSNAFCVHEQFSRPQLLEAMNFTEDIKISQIFRELLDGWDVFLSINMNNKEERLKTERNNTSYIYQIVKNLSLKNILSEKNHYDKQIESNYGKETELSFKNPIGTIEELFYFVQNYSAYMKADLPMTFLTYSMNYTSLDFFRVIKQTNGVIILNATYEKEVCEKLFKPTAILKTIEIGQSLKAYQKVYRIKGRENEERYATYGIGSLLYHDQPTEKFYELAEVTKKFTETHHQTVVFCVNKIYPILKKLFYKEWKLNQDNIKLDTFSKAIGKNWYEKFDGCVIFGTPYHNVDHAKKIREQRQITEDVNFRNLTINPMIQSIHRIRPLSWKEENHPCEILLLTSIPIENYIKMEREITKLELKEMRQLFDMNYLPKRCEIILGIIESKKEISMNELIIESKISKGTIQKYLDILINKNYIYQTESREKKKGRPERLFSPYSKEYRDSINTCESLKWRWKEEDYNES